MKVLHVISGSLQAGAARGALWLHHGLLKKSVQSRILSTHNDVSEPEILSVYNNSFTDGLLRKLRLAVDILPAYFYRQRKRRLFSSALGGINLTSHPAYKDADLIHLHWINAGMLSLSEIHKIDKPVVWTVRDMWPFTGGCHYALDCEKYKTGCGFCPLLGSKSERDLSSWNFKRKIKSLPENLQPVAISKWVRDCAESSPILSGKNTQVIHNCVDPALFTPVNRDTARSKLGWNNNEKIILGGALGLSSPWKGFASLINAVRLLGGDYKLALFGDTDDLCAEWKELLNYDLGRLYSAQELSTAYSAADLFIAPSHQEAFGKTLIEAMSCEAPVVAFNATGPADIVSHQSTGWLAEPFSAESMAEGIRWCCANNHNNQLGKGGRQRVIDLFSPDVIAGKYHDLYNSILNNYGDRNA